MSSFIQYLGGAQCLSTLCKSPHSFRYTYMSKIGIRNGLHSTNNTQACKFCEEIVLKAVLVFQIVSHFYPLWYLMLLPVWFFFFLIITSMLNNLTWTGLLPFKVMIALDVLKILFLKFFFEDNLKKSLIYKNHQDALSPEVIFKMQLHCI